MIDIELNTQEEIDAFNFLFIKSRGPGDPISFDEIKLNSNNVQMRLLIKILSKLNKIEQEIEFIKSEIKIEG